MNEALKQFTEDLKKELVAAISTDEIKAFVAKTLDAQDAGTFEVIISTADVDRSGESLIQEGMDNTNYINNPVVLYGHDYYSLPIGVCESLNLVDGKWVAKGRFAPADANPFAQQVRKLYDLKILRTTSVGLIVRETEGNKITKWELLEFSFVPVPANPYALSMRQVNEMLIDTAMLKTKGIDLKVKEEKAEPKEGDACTMDDESEGTMQMVDGALVCQIKKEEKGAIADEINEEEMCEQKWEKLDEVSEIINAFYSVYLDEATPVEDFKTLLTEMAQLLTACAGNDGADDDTIMASVMAYCTKNVSKKEFVQKTGARLSGKSIEALSKICDEHKNLNASLEAFIADEAKAEEAKDVPADDKLIEKRSKSVGPEKLLKGLDDYLALRSVLRSVDNAIGGALEDVNKSIREKSQSKK